jgi:allantoinase
MSRFLVYTGSKVLLPDSDTLQPATIVIDLATGKILNIYHAQIAQHDMQLPEDTTWLDAQDKVILPGLVE